ncbi:T9SS type A sorting domain-containing protein [uncultured Hymenobacter sp.]|uniref:T9SS type A sorting domain-containing protein n=1 Tax=uncultured Hymenobacter sp. TaxID=170016 RepID=UPI0035CA3CBD
MPQSCGVLAAPSTTASVNRLAIFPNPVSDGALTLLLPGTASSARLRLLDGQGRVVLDRAATLTSGQTGLDVRGLAAGLYLLQATTPGGVYTGKVAIE